MSISTSSRSGRSRTKLIVGIDYGTTYTGLAFAESTASDFRDIVSWTAYPGASGQMAAHRAKAPSTIAFADENDEYGDEDAWGYQVLPGDKSYTWTKLLLDKGALPSEYDDPGLKHTLGHGVLKLPRGKSAKDLVTAYFRGLKKMFDDAIDGKIISGRLKSLPVEVWLTVPATWTDKAKFLTRQAALDAGFASRASDRLLLIPEPEAAAHFTLKDSINRVGSFVKQGAGIMVCDLGGGTVDITTYQVQQVTPSLELREICVGVGGKCGSTFIDRNFYKLMVERFGKTFTSLGAEMTGPGSELMNQFQDKKHGFSLKYPQRRPHRLSLPMKSLTMTTERKKYYEPQLGYVLLTHDDMLNLFKPVADTILRLISDQMKQCQKSSQKINTVVLVGGFSDSPYIREVLKNMLDRRNVHLATPWNSSWSAIASGAVLRGIEGSITTERKCRRHYGFNFSNRYEPGIHHYDTTKRYVYKNVSEDFERLTGFTRWGVNKGDVLRRDSHIVREFTTEITRASLSEERRLDLYACSLDSAPETIENDAIEVVGCIKYTLEDVDLNLCEKTARNENGKKYYLVWFEVHIRLSDEAGLLNFRVIQYKGKQCGTADLAFSYT